jgi:hypothetical protein
MPIKYREEHRWACTECGWVGTEEMKLRAPSPFDKTVTITGCPQCREIERFEPLCEAVGCEDLGVSGGHPSPEGYRLTCWAHSPSNPANQEMKDDEGIKR